ncbi:MAG: hypothetical protein ACOCZ6_05380 [Nanoarchaeota archaeon]
MNAKKIFTNWRIIILVVAVVLSVLLIKPYLFSTAEGVAVRHVDTNSTAYNAGMYSPEANTKPLFREVITEINGIKIKSEEDYVGVINELDVNDSVVIKTKSSFKSQDNQFPSLFYKHEKDYSMQAEPEYNITELNETEIREVEEVVEANETINGTTKLVNKTVTREKEVPKIKKELIGPKPLGLDVYDAPSTNLKKGLDLMGGTRVLLEPERQLSEEEVDLIINNLKERLNVYGLSDIVVRPVQKGLFSEETLISVEIAGANEDEVKELVESQGKFEAKIGNESVFSGNDIKSVCRTTGCSYIENPQQPCQETEEGNWMCQFMFEVTISPEAAQRQAEITKELDVVTENGEQYLDDPLKLYLDNALVDELRVSAGLQGLKDTTFSISGPGEGRTYEEAKKNSEENMVKLQTYLETGSLPVKLDIVKTDSISPTLGEKFLDNAIMVGLAAILGVVAFILIRYRDLKVGIPVAITMLSEVIMILGIAAGTGWNIDMAAIAGIIIAVGTGVDDQIVILDEIRRGKLDALSWKERIQRAFFVIFAAFLTTLAAMLVLFSAGAGLLRGFAFTTILGITVGVFISRPAFASIAELLLKD